MNKKKEQKSEKSQLHPRNKHRQRYDFKKLIASCPDLSQFVILNKYDDESIDFFNPEAIKMLNKALLKHHYNIEYWDIPKNYLCPPIPGRADYIHYIADLLAEDNNGIIPKGEKIRCLDIGVGANCVYPILGNKEYDWSFVGSDIDPVSVKSSLKIVAANPSFEGKIDIRLQNNPKDLFRGVIQENEFFDVTICNPPFHATEHEALSGSQRKIENLKHKKTDKVTLNFGGNAKELCCDGGELKFIGDMIHQSTKFSSSCNWFTTLVSKKSNLYKVQKALKKANPSKIKIIEMGQGNKKSRIVAWSFNKK